ncbi:hypothetical protein [Yoonia sp. R2-816]|uniref:hypothetical protein n=1 Tax=Yoonia sp. R2-816 TaxID=3342638 RepID=UPI0037289C61
MSDGSKSVTIRRERGFYGIFRKLIVQVDGAELLRIKAGETLEAKLPAGARHLDMRMDWITTPPFDLADVRAGDTLVIYVQRRSFHQMSSLKEIPFGIRIDRP